MIRLDRFCKKVLETVRREGLIGEGSEVCVGFSGGPDSVCLLHVLKKLERILSCRVSALHVNHGLRGEEAERDLEFSQRFCRELSVPFSAVSVDVRSLVRREGLSVEEAARNLRYEAFSRTGKTVAVAHHAGDQAETVLFHLCRGTGLSGAAGMEYQRGNIIRPLLFAEKKEITAYLERNGLPFVTDSSNLSSDYSRNRIRNVILPELSVINEHAAGHLVEFSREMREADDFIRAKARETVSDYEKNGKNISIPRNVLKEESPIFRRYVIIEALNLLGVPLKDWGRVQFGALDRALFMPRGHHVDLPRGVTAENTRSFLVIERNEEVQT